MVGSDYLAGDEFQETRLVTVLLFDLSGHKELFYRLVIINTWLQAILNSINFLNGCIRK